MHSLIDRRFDTPARLRPAAKTADQSLFLDLPVPFRRVDGRLWVEAQVLNGLRLWSNNFKRLTVSAPVVPVGHSEEMAYDWADPGPLLATRGIALVALPWGYRHFDHFKLAKQVRAILKPLIASHQYLCLSNIGGYGAWGNLAVDLALAQHHPYSIWLDNVAHEMPRETGGSLHRTMKIWLDRQYSKSRTWHAIRHAGLGLFHGRTVFDAYAAICPQPELVHNIHCGPADTISDSMLAEKLARQQPNAVLRLGYAGRVHPIKGPNDWIDSLVELARRVGSHRFEATWYGSGAALDEARQRVEAAGLSSCVRFVGHVRDRETLLSSLRQLDAFVFCHLTPESPRCLIESLISGTPLVGYDSAYARDLISHGGGGDFVPIGDVTALARRLEHFIEDRASLSQLMQAAARARAFFSDEAVFKHRSDLIKQHLQWQEQAA